MISSNQPTVLALVVFSAMPAIAAESENELPPASEGQSWRLVWQDEFDGTKLDETKWTYRPDGKRKGGWWSHKAISLDGDGHLVITTFMDGDKPTDGCITTQGKFEHAHGYYVARVKFQKQPGHWSAFWINGPGIGRVGDGGRDGCEIDIMEKPWLDDRVQHTLHWDGYGRDHRSEGFKATVPGVMEGWHTFGLLWLPEQADSADRLPKDILEAHSIYEEDGLRRWELEARILAGQDDEKIARCCRVTTDVVSAYEQVFYNVRDSFDASDYLLCEALRYKPCVGFDAGDVRYFWAWVALDGEGLALDEVIVAFKKAYRPGEVVTLAVYLDDSVPVKLQGLVATMLLPVDSPAWQLLGSRSVAKTILGLDHGGFSIDRLRAKIVRAARAHAP